MHRFFLDAKVSIILFLFKFNISSELIGEIASEESHSLPIVDRSQFFNLYYF